MKNKFIYKMFSSLIGFILLTVVFSVKAKTFYKCLPNLQNCVSGDICHKYINILTTNECPLPVLVECDYGMVCCPFKWKTDTCNKKKFRVPDLNTNFSKTPNQKPHSSSETQDNKPISTSNGKKFTVSDLNTISSKTQNKKPNNSSNGEPSTYSSKTGNKPSDSISMDRKYCLNEAGCGRSSQKHIINGEIARLGQFPWIAYISISEGSSSSCGGVLITLRHLLSACHCFKNISFVNSVTLGIVDLDKERNESDQRQIFKDVIVTCHEKYSIINDTKINDIAILELPKPVQKSSVIVPICFPTHNEIENEMMTSPMYISGWGVDDKRPYQRIGSRQLKYGNVEKFDKCQHRITKIRPRLNLNIFENKVFCASSPNGTDLCRGDSGGPIQGFGDNGSKYLIGISLEIIGICGDPEDPSLYIRALPYFEWIKRRIGC